MKRFHRHFYPFYALVILMCCMQFSLPLTAQQSKPALQKVLTLAGAKYGAADIPQDHGYDGIWQELLKLQTTGSVMHTQAHPDDEQADLLTYLGRGKGVRTSLLSLNRGESGGNILGPESFDQLGLLRTEEFLLAASYYGLDDLYFTKLVDYGYSKNVEEAYDKWGKNTVLEEIVRVIRINRPLVIVSRFHGSERDGHGNHQAAGEISQQAFKMAADPAAFPEQISKEGLRPWKALKLYRGGVKATERFNVALNSGVYCPWLGDSYKNFSMLGYSFHRSQFGGQRNDVKGDFTQYFERLASNVKSTEKEADFLDGIETSVSKLLSLTGEVGPATVQPFLNNIQQSAAAALAAFKPGNEKQLVEALTKGLAATRSALKLLSKQPESSFLLQVKERQFMDAINSVLGISLDAIAMPANAKEPTNFYEPPVTMGFAVPSQALKVHVSLVNPANILITPSTLQLVDASGEISNLSLSKSTLGKNQQIDQTVPFTIAADARFSKPYYRRDNIQQSSYQYDGDETTNLPNSTPALIVFATYLVNGQSIELRKPVEVRQSNQPYGFDKYVLKIAPPVAVNLQPSSGIVAADGSSKTIDVQVELINNNEGKSNGVLALQLPAGWQAAPSSTNFAFSNAGEKSDFVFTVTIPEAAAKTYSIKAVALVNGKQYSEGYSLSTHRDLDQTLLYHPATMELKGIDVKAVPGLKIGYVMGAGDEVPAGVRQLGATVHLLGSQDLATAKLDQFDVIMIGTRAYAVRQDLNTYNSRLLEYAKNGGHLLVLFQTPEFVPGAMAPFPADLPGNPEEVSEEDSPVKIVATDHPVFHQPNKITLADFDGWMEQRGSKFFASWDAAYKPMIETQDRGQAPQQGGWLMADYGKGHYTYFAYSLHRQLPNAVTGAFRILANLLSYGKN